MFNSVQDRCDLFKDLFPQKCDDEGHREGNDEIEQIRLQFPLKHEHRDPLDQIDLQGIGVEEHKNRAVHLKFYAEKDEQQTGRGDPYFIRCR